MGNAQNERSLEYRFSGVRDSRDIQSESITSIQRILEKVEEGVRNHEIWNENLIRNMLGGAEKYAKDQRILLIFAGAVDAAKAELMNSLVQMEILPARLPKNVIVQIGYTYQKDIIFISSCNPQTFHSTDEKIFQSDNPLLIQEKILQWSQQVPNTATTLIHSNDQQIDGQLKVFEVLLHSTFFESFPSIILQRIRILDTPGIPFEDRHIDQPVLTALKHIRDNNAPLLKAYIWVSSLSLNNISFEKSLFESVCKQLHLRDVTRNSDGSEIEGSLPSQQSSKQEMSSDLPVEGSMPLEGNADDDDDFWIIDKNQAVKDTLEVERRQENLCYLRLEKVRRQLLIVVNKVEEQKNSQVPLKTKFLEKLENSLSGNVMVFQNLGKQKEIVLQNNMEYLKRAMIMQIEGLFEYKQMKRRFKIQELIDRSSACSLQFVLNAQKREKIDRFIKESIPVMQKNHELLVRGILNQLQLEALDYKQRAIEKVEELFKVHKTYTIFDNTEGKLLELSNASLHESMRSISAAMTNGDKLIEINKNTVLGELENIDKSLAEGIRSVIADFKKRSLLEANQVIVESIGISFQMNSNLVTKILSTSSVATGVSLLMSRMAGKSIAGCGPLGVGVAVGATVLQTAFYVSERERLLRQSKQQMQQFFENLEQEQIRLHQELSVSYAKVNEDVLMVISDYLNGICSLNLRELSDQQHNLNMQERIMKEKRNNNNNTHNENDEDSEEDSDDSSVCSEPSSPLRPYRGEQLNNINISKMLQASTHSVFCQDEDNNNESQSSYHQQYSQLENSSLVGISQEEEIAKNSQQEQQQALQETVADCASEISEEQSAEEHQDLCQNDITIEKSQKESQQQQQSVSSQHQGGFEGKIEREDQQGDNNNDDDLNFHSIHSNEQENDEIFYSFRSPGSQLNN